MVRALPTLAARARRTPAPALALGTYALAHVLLIASFGDGGVTAPCTSETSFYAGDLSAVFAAATTG